MFDSLIAMEMTLTSAISKFYGSLPEPYTELNNVLETLAKFRFEISNTIPDVKAFVDSADEMNMVISGINNPLSEEGLREGHAFIQNKIQFAVMTGDMPDTVRDFLKKLILIHFRWEKSYALIFASKRLNSYS